jgi:hypothetical protein
MGDAQGNGIKINQFIDDHLKLWESGPDKDKRQV